MIDFSKINSFGEGQRYAFEELMCQLASHESFPEGAQFQRVEGSGGDGGVEAYWTRPDGRKVCYQAKYFLRAGAIDWDQVESSVLQAIRTHPEVSKYVIGFPCDLTDRTGVKKRGKSGWEHWKQRTKKWETLAAAQGISDIEFEPWPKNEFLKRLFATGSEGLRENFFGDIALTQSWFRQKLDEAILSLDERYHPEDHVDVRIQELFSTISRDKVCIQGINKKISDIKRKNKISISNEFTSTDTKKILEKIKKAYDNILTIEKDLQISVQQEWPLQEWNNRINVFLGSLEELRKYFWDNSRSIAENSKQKNELYEIIDDVGDLYSAAKELEGKIDSKYMHAESSRVAFIRGIAGAGKSHLLAKCADMAIQNGQAAVMLLGQQFNDTDLWIQISSRLGLAGRTPDQLLGALESVGHMRGVRTLLLIDAINEGAGCRFWRNNIGVFIKKLEKYKNICCVVSCRTEYFDVAIPDGVLRNIPVFDIRGFETPEEQLEAAQVYLDKRGIARPTTPWLAPEFVNPLFLRSICISLEQDQKSELPPGLTGTKKILKYYLESMARNIQLQEKFTISLVSRLGRTVQAIAAEMLVNKIDYVDIDACRRVIEKNLGSVKPTSESEWLAVLLRNGLLRKDPNPRVEDDFFSDEDVIRFSFQRFQDFLIAEKAIEDISDITHAFAPTGPLRFIVSQSEDVIRWEWFGFIDALSIVLPEKFNRELVDCLPGGFSTWWHNSSVTEAFVESVKWRERSSFSDRSLELLNDLDRRESLDVLIQVAISADHPWNAEMLDRNLKRRKMPERDAFWTTWLNDQSADSDSDVGVLIEWCLGGQVSHTNSDNQFLAALVLCWVFTSSNRPMRDRATKALTSLFLRNQGIFIELLKRFEAIDDYYILERLLAAAYGGCCRSIDKNQLAAYAEAVHTHIFASGAPPYGILLRDYALGIIELAKAHSALPDSVNLGLCKPPYKSPRPKFTVTEKQLDNLAEKAGDGRIVRSCTSFTGDFGQYQINSKTRRFLKVLLTKQAPVSAKQKFSDFEEKVVGTNRKKMIAFEALKLKSSTYFLSLYGVDRSENDEKPSEREIAKWEAERAEAESVFLDLLSNKEIVEFEKYAAPILRSSDTKKLELPEFDLAALKRWVAKRAYDYGWNDSLFPNDNGRASTYTRNRPLVERIGKKYQWLALNELLCRLSDNYWMSGEYDGPHEKYDNPTSIGFLRDVDPTITEQTDLNEVVPVQMSSGELAPSIKLKDVDEASLAAWPFEHDPGIGLKQMAFRTDDNGKRWLVVYEYQSATNKYQDGKRFDHDLRQQEFRILAATIVKKADVTNIVSKTKVKNEIDLYHWPSPEFVDEGYLYEAPWRMTWPQDKWCYNSSRLPTGVPYAPLAVSYFWESHVDASLPDGYRTWLPMPWLASTLDLRPELSQIGAWRNQSGEVVFKHHKLDNGGEIALICSNHLEKVLGDKYTSLSFLISERIAWPGGGNENSAWRRAEGLCWRDGRGMNQAIWKHDKANGSSKRLISQD